MAVRRRLRLAGLADAARLAHPARLLPEEGEVGEAAEGGRVPREPRVCHPAPPPLEWAAARQRRRLRDC